MTLQLPEETRHTVVIRSTPLAASEPAPAAPDEPACEPPALVPGRREAIDLTAWFNAEQLKTVNHGAPCMFDFSGDMDADGMLAIGDAAFRVRPTGKNMVKIEAGHLVRGVDAFEPTEAPDAVAIPVGKPVKGVEFLFAGECRCRLTGMEIGMIILRYADGAETVEPLVLGGNVDCSHFPFATAVTRRTLTYDPVSQFPITVAAFAVAADAARILQDVELRVFAADAAIALIAMNTIG